MQIDMQIGRTGLVGQQQTGAVKREDKQDADLKKACREFESLMLAQILKKMRDSVPKCDIFGSAEKEKIYQDMLDDEMAKNISQTGTLGLGDLIYKQLNGQQIAKVPPQAVESSHEDNREPEQRPPAVEDS